MEIRGLGGIHSGRSIPVNGSVVIGRNPQACTVVYPDSTKGVSRLHCRVDSGSGGGTLTDLGSSYGTFLNGRKLPPNVPTPLHDGDTFYVGDQSNMFSVSGAGSQGGSSAPASNSKGSSGGKGVLIGVLAAIAVIVIAVVAVLLLRMNQSKPYDITGTTWRVESVPGMRLSFAENGDLIWTDQGDFEMNGTWSYSPAGDNTVSVKYSAPVSTVTVTEGGDLKIFGILGYDVNNSESVVSQYSKGSVWKFIYDDKTKSVEIMDVNNYHLMTLVE
ncbi:MAG: FHA domain-containing protein [Lachnospiraceae bacterium]|nr:FHA domain-containing protein [Lachnospiraceae bacterium]